MACSRKKILLFGDSITQNSFSPDNIGWGTRLANRFDRQADVVVRGFSGYNTRWGLAVLEFGILTSNNSEVYDVATIFFGANDAVSSDDPQHCPIEEYQNNIESMINLFRNYNPNVKLMLITPGTVDNTIWNTRHPDRVAQYAEVVRAIGKDKRVPVVDLWMGALSLNINDFCDGLHLSKSGNDKVYRGVMEILENELSGSIPEDLQFPQWRSFTEVSPSGCRDMIQKWEWSNGPDVSNEKLESKET